LKTYIQKLPLRGGFCALWRARRLLLGHACARSNHCKRLSNHVVCQHLEKGAGVRLLISKLLIAASHYQHGTPQDTSPGILLRNVI